MSVTIIKNANQETVCEKNGSSNRGEEWERTNSNTTVQYYRDKLKWLIKFQRSHLSETLNAWEEIHQVSETIESISRRKNDPMNREN